MQFCNDSDRPPYFENAGKRLIKSPKLYFPDVGLNRAILGDITINKGVSYETWVFSELLKWKQLQPVEPELFFYRTSAGMEIDFLIAGEEQIVPIEVKAHDKATSADGRNIEAFIKEHPGKAKFGIIVYKGSEIAEVRKNIWAIPDWYLFGTEYSGCADKEVKDDNRNCRRAGADNHPKGSAETPGDRA